MPLLTQRWRGQNLYYNVTYMYPDSNIWVVGEPIFVPLRPLFTLLTHILQDTPWVVPWHHSSE